MGSIWLRHASGATASHIYKIQNLTDLQINHSSPASPMPLPEEDEAENILIKIEGNSGDVSISWVIKEETTDVYATVSDGSIVYSTDTDKGTIWSQRNFCIVLYQFI